jgi:hypothetical protein
MTRISGLAKAALFQGLFPTRHPMTTSASHEKTNAGRRESYAGPALAWTLVILGLLLWWEVEIQPLSDWVLAAVYLMGLAALSLSFRLSRSADREWTREEDETGEACEHTQAPGREKIHVL